MGRPSVSKIHSYFNFNKSLNESACKNCECKIKGNHGTNLTNLKRHLASHHDELYEEYMSKELKKNNCVKKITKKESQLNLFNFLVPKVKVQLNKNIILDACIDLVTVNRRPFKKKFTINSYLIKKHVHAESLFIQDEIANEVQSKLISLKLDGVTRLNRAFLGVNMQYIVDDCIKLRTLGLVELTESHTGVYLKETILKILKKFKIEQKQLYTITSDNGANMLKAINLVEEEISATVAATTESNYELNDESIEETADVSSDSSSYDSSDSTEAAPVTDLLYDEQIAVLLNEDIECIDKEYEETEHVLNRIELANLGDCSIFNGIRCVAHTLQLAVIDTLKHNSIDKLLNKVRLLVRKLRNQTYIYLIKKEKLKLPILDCPTRWHSTFDMIERLQHLKAFIQNMAANDSKLRKFELSHFEWQQVDILFKTLLPAKICTKKLQYEQLTLTDFYGAWIACRIETESLNNEFSNKLVQCLRSREQNIMNNQVLLAAIFLDPRFSITLTEDQCNIAITHLINIWFHIKELETSQVDSNNANIEIENNIDESLTNNYDTDILEDFLKQKENDKQCSSISSLTSSQPNSQNSISTKMETLLKTYQLDEKRLNHKTNILEFWKTMKKKYPEIYQLSQIVFSVPATQVSVERLFSGLKFILSPYRCNITPIHLEDQLLVRTNRLFEKNYKKINFQE
ncbi:hypothetical protein AGLY_016267 [Aphis glycines]|uniref:HAT C-terminal dimerisation domain-containing protein n=1 Tax=Aphis glycines TaxID=307491 RepID=A0A6G0SYB6_APHGL|nr:hypothetical protein AGLY_016267 [Aphis glycines]